jgi:hypothetical protein
MFYLIFFCVRNSCVLAKVDEETQISGTSAVAGMNYLVHTCPRTVAVSYIIKKKEFAKWGVESIRTSATSDLLYLSRVIVRMENLVE